MPDGRRHVLAISSGGGHWVQLRRVLPALAGHELTCASVDEAYRAEIPPDARFLVIPDANRWSKLALVRSALRVAWIVLRTRPDVVVSTGAAPGWFGLVLGKLCGARTVWIDSIANAERLSSSGEKARRWADLWLTQWPHLMRPEGPRYLGSVL